MRYAIDLTGQNFGRWTVIHRVPNLGKHSVWLCHCRCGGTATVNSDVLRRGKSKSCGCFRLEVTRALGLSSKRHGEGSNNATTTPEYRAWASMLSRCRNPRHVMFKHYGARGIKVCERWYIYENFLADMGRKPTLKHSIDRINNAGNYEPENCRWATSQEQNRNRRGNRLVTIRGETRTLAEWLQRTGIARATFYWRIARGVSDEEALTHSKSP